MKKLKNKILLLLTCLLVLPFSLLLTGCGATPVSSVKTIKFVSDLYDKTTGYAIFEVDLNKETNLTYKLTPSSGIAAPTCSVFVFNNNPESTEEDSAQNRSRFRLENDLITILDEKFEEIIVKIQLGSLQDFCIVRLKKYPEKIYLDKSGKETTKEVFVNAGAEYTIHLFGNFSADVNNPDIREIFDSEFKFLVESSDETVVNVLNNSRLKVCTLKQKTETATVSIYMLDTTDNVLKYPDGTDVKVTVVFTVVLPPASTTLLVDGYGKFVNENETIDIVAKPDQFDTELGPTGEWAYYLVGYQTIFLGGDNSLITEKMYTITVTTNQDKFVKVNNEKKQLMFRKPTTEDSINVKVTVTSSANDKFGNAYSMSFYINFTFPTEANVDA